MDSIPLINKLPAPILLLNSDGECFAWSYWSVVAVLSVTSGTASGEVPLTMYHVPIHAHPTLSLHSRLAIDLS